MQDVRSPGGLLSSADKWRGGFFRYGRLHFLVLKVFEIYDVSERTRGGGGGITDILRTKGRGQFFVILCGRLLWMALNIF